MAPVLIAQADVFINPGRRSDAFPLIVVLQADAVAHTSSVLVAPLVPVEIVSASRLTPTFDIEGRTWTMVVADLAPIPRHLLTRRVASLARERDRITAALDLLFFGF